MSVRLYMIQRGSAALMVPLIALHIWLIYYATAKGLTAADVMYRTRGNWGWGAYYTAFVLLATMHAAIGIRGVLADWTALDRPALDTTAMLFAVVLLTTGLRAVAAVVLP